MDRADQASLLLGGTFSVFQNKPWTSDGLTERTEKAWGSVFDKNPWVLAAKRCKELEPVLVADVFLISPNANCVFCILDVLTSERKAIKCHMRSNDHRHGRNGSISCCTASRKE